MFGSTRLFSCTSDHRGRAQCLSTISADGCSAYVPRTISTTIRDTEPLCHNHKAMSNEYRRVCFFFFEDIFLIVVLKIFGQVTGPNSRCVLGDLDLIVSTNRFPQGIFLDTECVNLLTQQVYVQKRLSTIELQFFPCRSGMKFASLHTTVIQQPVVGGKLVEKSQFLDILIQLNVLQLTKYVDKPEEVLAVDLDIGVKEIKDVFAALVIKELDVLERIDVGFSHQNIHQKRPRTLLF